MQRWGLKIYVSFSKTTFVVILLVESKYGLFTFLSYKCSFTKCDSKDAVWSVNVVSRGLLKIAANDTKYRKQHLVRHFFYS